MNKLPQIIEMVPIYKWNKATGMFDAIVLAADGATVVAYAIRPAIFVEIQRAVEDALDGYFACPVSDANVVPLRKNGPS